MIAEDPRALSPASSPIAFTVPGEPVSWKRARRGNGRTFTDPKDAAHRERIRAFARNAGLRHPFAGPVRLAVTFYVSRPVLDVRVGDLDNLEKAVKDALQGIAFSNDRQVCRCVKEKAQDTVRPRTEIEIAKLGAPRGQRHVPVSEIEAEGDR